VKLFTAGAPESAKNGRKGRARFDYAPGAAIRKRVGLLINFQVRVLKTD
jgi:hypothetical protein